MNSASRVVSMTVVAIVQKENPTLPPTFIVGAEMDDVERSKQYRLVPGGQKRANAVWSNVPTRKAIDNFHRNIRTREQFLFRHPK